jgi:streptomycin 6-kinase
MIGDANFNADRKIATREPRTALPQRFSKTFAIVNAAVRVNARQHSCWLPATTARSTAIFVADERRREHWPSSKVR